MNNELKCPVCQQDLRKLFNRYTGEPNCDYECGNFDCELYGIEIPESVWKAVIQKLEDLKIVTKALKEMQHWLGVVRCSMVSHLNNQNNTLLEHYETDSTVQNIDKAKSILKQYLEQITHDNSEKANSVEHKEI